MLQWYLSVCVLLASDVFWNITNYWQVNTSTMCELCCLFSYRECFVCYFYTYTASVDRSVNVYNMSYGDCNILIYWMFHECWGLATVSVVEVDIFLLYFVCVHLPELFALPHPNFFKFHIPTSGWIVLFSVSAPTLWNSLPHGVRFCESVTTLNFLFSSGMLWCPLATNYTPAPQIQFVIFGALYIHLLTYLLTCLLPVLCYWGK